MIQKVAIVGVPVVAILQRVSTDGRFIGLCLLVFMVAMSNMGLIVLPKMITVWRMHRIGSASPPSVRGSREVGTRISGLVTPTVSAGPAVAGDHSMDRHEGIRPSRIQTVTFE